MFRRFILAFTDPELRGKLIKIGLLLVAARLLAYVPIPVLSVEDLSPLLESDAVFNLLNVVAGGSYGRLSFVMLGVGPFITASIVMQLLGVIVPKINEIQKEQGEAGRQKINRWTRYLTVPLAALNSWGILQFLTTGTNETGVSIDLPDVLTQTEVTAESFGYWFAIIASMVAGSIIMMYIGEIITEFKMGNGVSIIILTGIVARLPQSLFGLLEGVWPTFTELFTRFSFDKLVNIDVWKALLWQNGFWQPVRDVGIFFLSFILMLLLVIFVNDALKRLTVVYSRRGHTVGKSRTLGNVKADLPVKVNMAGVIPIIFAVSFILFPSIVSRFFFTSTLPQLQEVAQEVETYLSTQPVEQQPIPSAVLPKTYAGISMSRSPEQIEAIQNYDLTQGQEILGFTVSSSPEVQTRLFTGTFAEFEFDASGALGFLPEGAWYWDGVLAYTFFYFILIIFFTYFYTSSVAFKTDDVAENLQKSGAYIPGLRPGMETQEYLSYLSNRLNVAGSLFLAVIAVIPIALTNNIAFQDSTLSGIVGGTTLLILVSVTVETLKQIEAQATSIDYERFTTY